MEEVIKTVNLSKHFGDVEAVSELSLNVRKGEIYGFLGLNGAGKTTTIRMLLGMVNPSSGQAYIHGEKVYANNNELWKKTGYLVEIPYAYPNLTVKENLEIIRRLRFIKDKNAIQHIVERLELTQYINKKAKNLSLGNKQRLGLAKALIHNPEILILDEPANGLDPAGIHDIREMLRTLAADQGVTIFISSHILGEISRFATRVGIIHHGKMVKEINTDQLEALCRKNLVVRSHDLKATQSLLIKNGYKECIIENELIKIQDEKAIEQPEQIARLLVNGGHPLTQLHITEEDLESYFLRVINKNGGTK